MMKGKIMMKIAITDAGEIVVVDDKDQPMDPTPMGNSLEGKTIIRNAQISVITSNPCGWVWHNGQWYWRCRP
ncbi:MAG: hypothetical protein GTN53_18305 [Candidatus Aminicenantes bacterium]|nr:hypothetical protein [Candidatus Aminicenantes bacterium]NIQ68402.1 hypothetical protein [Candidatus Aminicenantes bacterium]NIT24450.1 hypothetical protein [Candidatus Aminicenantes bacterium]